MGQHSLEDLENLPHCALHTGSTPRHSDPALFSKRLRIPGAKASESLPNEKTVNFSGAKNCQEDQQTGSPLRHDKRVSWGRA